jgi:hypothetical protein
VLPTHDVELSTRGDATAVVGPGEIRCRLVDLLVAALEAVGQPGEIELVVGNGIVTATGGGEIRF